ncbi:MAG TPA: lysyl oxidase family protein [Candidatus Thermoplasmatota archaeon]|nr:lysyl oxidase family protein [Candidatus Thermoplasmatota archaeon]
MRAWVPILLLLAGCVAPAAELDAARGTLLLDGAPAGETARWSGGPLTGPRDLAMFANDLACWAEAPRCEEPPVECASANCERRAFAVGEGAGSVTLTVRWPTMPALLDAWIEDASGAVVAVAPHRYIGPFGLAARLDAPAPGEYVAVVAARAGRADYEAALRVEPPRADAEPRPLLPDLVTLPPTDLTLETPDYVGVSYFAFPAPGVREAMETAGRRGCRVDESAEYGAARCLRFSNAVGNLGEGPLDVSLRPGELAFTQHVHWSDGRTEAHAAGAAEWHATHAHWHNAASNRFTVHPYDAATGERGPALNEGRKGGICFADVGLVDVGLPNTWPADQTGWNCFEPRRDTHEWRMGITPGWYDLYARILSDQYVDITGVPDGTYALCSVTNGDGTLLEADITNNEACTAFRLKGDRVVLLDPLPYHTMRE